jgi:general secretion pathway protein I
VSARVRPAGSRSGFTLLEVMVAIAILALSLTAIFSSEAGAIKMAARSRKLGLATLLVRCKMGEIEEDVANKGLPALFASGSDTCCKESDIDGFSCDWEIEPVLMPDNMFAPQDPTAAGLPATGKKSSTGAAPSDPLAAVLGAATAATAGPQKPAGGNAVDAVKNLDPAQVLSGGGLGGIASLALSYAYPVLKPSFEAQIRRATVTVHWKEGTVSHAFDVTQYLVADQALALDPTTGQPLAGPQQGGLGLPGQPQPIPGQTLPAGQQVVR